MLKKLAPYLTLFTSFGTLVCCALPALFVSLGMGATLVSVLGALPQLIWFSKHKMVVFGLAGICLTLAGISRWRSRTLSCPTDPELVVACMQSRSVSGLIYYLSLGLYLTGVFFAFIGPRIF